MAEYKDNELVSKILASNNIVDVIGEYINLEHKGKNFFGVCPFHDDHSPSMSVSPEKNIFKCFSCGASGNSITFLMDYLGIDFKEALKILADKAGIFLDNSFTKKKVDNELEELYKINNLAVSIFKNNLVSLKGKEAREYLKKRGLDEETIKYFNIGLAIDNSISRALSNKYSKELKLEIVKRYLNGESAISLANKYGMTKRGAGLIMKWINKYKTLGEKSFDSSPSNKAYSKELKQQVINDYLNGIDSLEGLANKYNITSDTIVINWIKKYNKGIEIKDYDPKGDVYTMKSRKTTLEERLEIVNYVLANNNDYKGAADKYSVPYANVYKWVKKYNESGEDGLSDSRGRPSSKEPKHELSDIEKKEIEIEKLKQELKRKDMVIEVLKKNIEIQERMERDSRLLGKKTNTKR